MRVELADSERIVFRTPERNPKHRYLLWHGSYKTGSWTGSVEDKFPSVRAAKRRIRFWERMGFDVKIEDLWLRDW